MHEPEPLLPCSKKTKEKACTACSLEDSGWCAPKRAARTARGTVVRCFSLSLPVLLLVSMSFVSRRASSSASCDLMLRGQAFHAAKYMANACNQRYLGLSHVTGACRVCHVQASRILSTCLANTRSCQSDKPRFENLTLQHTLAICLCVYRTPSL